MSFLMASGIAMTLSVRCMKKSHDLKRNGQIPVCRAINVSYNFG